MFPQLLPEPVLMRAFHAGNGELGIMYQDANAYLDACAASGIEILGWELWIINHTDSSSGTPIPARGAWCGAIPSRKHDVPIIVGGEGNAEICKKQISELNLHELIQGCWLPFIRVNFTLDN